MGSQTGDGRRNGAGYRYRSLFWPAVLIAVGIIWLLLNLGVLGQSNLDVLARLWPVLLVGIGVDLVAGHRSPALGGLIGVITVGVIVVLIVIGPSLGWAGDTEVKTQTFTTPVGRATAARVELGLSRYPTTVHALDASPVQAGALLAATLSYRGDIDFTSTGESEKVVSLRPRSRWSWLDWSRNDPDLHWDIALTPSLPLNLAVDSSSGKAVLDLSQLRLTGFSAVTSSGETQVTLPRGSDRYPVELRTSSGSTSVRAADGIQADLSAEVSSGSAKIVLGQNSDTNMRFSTSSGSLRLECPAGTALRVEVKKVSSGSVRVPAGLTRLSGSSDGEEGVWETPGFAGASPKVSVVVDSVSSGSVEVRFGP